MNSGLDYLLTRYAGGNEALLLYYDFEQSSAFVHQEDIGGVTYYTGGLYNMWPDPNSGSYNLLLEGITGSSVSDTEADILAQVTDEFLNSGNSGNLMRSPLLLTGAPEFDLHNCTYLFSTKKIRPKAGVLFASLKKVTGEVAGNYYESSRGYNIGINARNQLFFQGLGREGLYILTANQIELANKNICSVSIGYDTVDFSCLNPATNQHQQQHFAVETQYIYNHVDLPNFLYGDDVDYLEDGTTFSGFMDDFALFSGVLDIQTKASLASGFISDLELTTGLVETITTVTGYDTQILYDTGITGVEVKITGSFLDKRSGVLKEFGTTDIVSGSLVEGTLYFTGTTLSNDFADSILEREGAVVDDLIYETLDDTAEGTLGLTADTISAITSSHSITFTSPETTGIMQVFPSGLSGFLYDSPTGKIQTELTEDTYVTGDDSYQLIPQSGKLMELKHDLIYFLGQR